MMIKRVYALSAVRLRIAAVAVLATALSFTVAAHAYEFVGEAFTKRGGVTYVDLGKFKGGKRHQRDFLVQTFPELEVQPEDQASSDGTTFAEGFLEGDQRESFLQDIMRVQFLMQQPKIIHEELKKVAKVLERKKHYDANDPDGWLDIALRAMEKEHWFPDYKVVALGILDPTDFLRIANSGIVLIDVGAGVEHGEFAHRLQWAAIMSDFDAHPNDWNNSPIELYVKIGRHDTSPPTHAGQEWRSLFGYLFDQSGQDFEGDMDGYRHPDRLTKFLVDTASSTPKDLVALQKIAAAVGARFNQRKILRDDVFNGSRNGEAMKAVACQLSGKFYQAWSLDPRFQPSAADDCAEGEAGNYEVEYKLFIHDNDRARADEEMSNLELYQEMRFVSALYAAKKIPKKDYLAYRNAADPDVQAFFPAMK